MDFQVVIDQVDASCSPSKPEDALEGLWKSSRGWPTDRRTEPLERSKQLHDFETYGPKMNLKGLAQTDLTGLYWVTLPNEGSYKAFSKKVEAALTVMPVASMPRSFVKPMTLVYRQDSKKTSIGVPRFWGLSMFGSPTKDHRVDAKYEGPTKFLGTLKDMQVKAVEQTQTYFRTWGGATMIADCGFGKTATAIALGCFSGQKCLILCNREILMDQWVDAIQKFCGPTTVGYIQRWPYNKGPQDGTLTVRPTDTNLFETCLFTVGSIQSFSECEYPKDLYKKFGLVIIDEMHHIAAKSLVHVVPLFHARRVLGLTATPNRSDGLEDVLYWLTGPVSFVYQRTPEVTGVRGSVIVTHVVFTQGLQKEIMYKDGSLGIASMMTELSNDDTRNECLEFLIRKALEHRAKVMVVVSHVAHGKLLFDRNITEKQAIMCGPHQMPEKAKDPDTRIVFATYSLLEEGYDDPKLDALVLAMPRSRVQQTIGRVERSHPGKQVPWVLDLTDAFSMFPAMHYKRKSFYKSRGFSYRSYTWTSGNDALTPDV